MDQNQMDRYLGQTLDGRYEILEVIGRGGMAVVYKARCHLLNRNVAIKILRDDMAADAEFREHFQKEAQAVAMLSHANIVSIYDVSRSPDVDYIVMELIEGITLKMYMQSQGALKTKECVHFATQIARALAHAHGKGIVHRDIKPQNIMICMDGSVKVADFGIAYLESAQAVNEGTAVGSVHYISPEQAKGQPVDARADLYSLGVVMYEMLTGRQPYIGETAEAIALQHVNGTPLKPREVNPEIPEALERITLKAMAPDIEQRYQTAEELLHDLDVYRLSVTAAIPEISAPTEGTELTTSSTEIVVVPDNVAPVSRSGELSKEKFARRHRRANKVSFLSGLLILLVFAVALFAVLWNYWLKAVFAPAQRIDVQNFVGCNYEDIINSLEFQSIYKFTVVFTVDPDVPADIIIEQTPKGGKNVMNDGDGVNVELKVSTGIQMIEVPSVINKEYRDAQVALQKAGFVVDYVYVTSEEVTENYVVSTNPEPGESLPVGATVYMSISSGPDIVTLQMPNLIGLSRSQATARIEGANLSLGTVTLVESEKPAGVVIWQSVTAYTMVEEHTKIYLQVSSGPKATPTPEPTPTPTPVQTPAANADSQSGDITPIAPTMN